MAMPRWGLVALLLGGCASAPLPDRSTDHPADAAAPQAPVMPAVDALDAFVLPGSIAPSERAAHAPASSTDTEDPHAGHR